MCLCTYPAANLLETQIQEIHQDFKSVFVIKTSAYQRILNNPSMADCWEEWLTATASVTNLGKSGKENGGVKVIRIKGSKKFRKEEVGSRQ